MDGNGRQFVKYDFFKVRREWSQQVWDEQRGDKDEFAAVVSEMPDLLMTRAYSLVGLRGDADFLLWHTSETLEGLQSNAARLRSTGMAQFLDQPYSYLAMTRQSEYVSEHLHEGQEGTLTKVIPSEAKYLIVYPFVKTREWYLLPKEERQRMMSEHFRIGHKYPSVSIHTSYSFGLDDYEFMLGFETDDPDEFLDLVAELRTVEGSMFTKLDTPIFTCVSMSIEEALDSLGGARA